MCVCFPCSVLHLVFFYNYSLICLTFHSFPSFNLNINNRFALICFLCVCELWRIFHNSPSHFRQVIMGFLGYISLPLFPTLDWRVKVSSSYIFFVRTSKRLITILQLAGWIGRRNWGGWKQALSFMIEEGCVVLNCMIFLEKKKQYFKKSLVATGIYIFWW